MEEQDDPLTPTRIQMCREKGLPWKPVALLPENETIAETYMLTRAQVVTSVQGQPIDVSIPALKIVMDLYGIENQRECLMRVRHLWHQIERKREEQEQYRGSKMVE